MKRIPTLQSRCRFGIARADITPPVGMYHRMWGAAAHDQSEGIHRRLLATAMSFISLATANEPHDRMVLLTVDHCLLGPQEVDAILERVAEQTGLDRRSLVLTFSHTHAAGLLNLDRSGLPGGAGIPRYLQQLGGTLANLVDESERRAVEVDIVYGSGRCNLAADRDLWDDDAGEYVCGYNPGVPADDTLVVASITNAAGQRIASIVNYACHPTTLAWQNRLISPDFPGAMRETVERQWGGTCVYLQGASGELGPVEGFEIDPALADRNGRQLAYAALSTLESLPPPNTSYQYAGKVVSGASIGTWKRVPIDNQRSVELARWKTLCDPIALDYREDLPSIASVQSQLAVLDAQEREAQAAGNTRQASELRALSERQLRMLGRLQVLPPGDTFPFQAFVWRIGDAAWVAVQGEPYSLLQTELRRAFPHQILIITPLANGWGPSYLPPSETYGRGIYQESIAALAPGSLETLIQTLITRVRQIYEDHGD